MRPLSSPELNPESPNQDQNLLTQGNAATYSLNQDAIDRAVKEF